MSIGWLRNLKNTILNSVFPLRCSSCGAFDTPLCVECAKKLWEPHTISLHTISTSRLATLTTAGHYANPELRHAMEAYKFHNVRTYAPLFGQLLADALLPLLTQLEEYDMNRYKEYKPIILVSVPLHTKRLRERGFDQNALIAQECAHVLQKAHASQSTITYLPDALVRSRATAHQTTIDPEKRAENVSHAFAVSLTIQDTVHFSDSHVIIVDDIITSGATIGSCAIAMSEKSPLSMHAAAVLRSQK